MITDPMIGGKTRAQWDRELAPLLAAAKKSNTQKMYRGYIIASVLLVGFAYVAGHFRPPSSGHEVLVYVLLAWFGHGMYCYGRSEVKR